MVQVYRKADDAHKFEIIYKNYSCFLRMVDSIISGLAYEIESEILFNRRQAKGDLGVRVQTSGISDVTGNTAATRGDIANALKACNFSGGILDDCDNPEEYIMQALVLDDMRRDYFLFEDQLGGLSERDHRILLPYILKDKDIITIASEENVCVETLRGYVRDAKKVVKTNTLYHMNRRKR